MVAPNKRIKLFNRLLNEFLDDYDKIYNVKTPRTKITQLKVLNTFKDEINYVREAFFNCDESSFKNITLCKTIDLDKRENFTLQNRVSIWKYLHNLYILTHEAPDKGSISQDAKQALDKLQGKAPSSTSQDLDLSQITQLLPNKAIPKEMGGLIEDIAAQVSKTLEGKDLSNINPMELMNSLMSGNGNATINGIDFGSILKNTTEKIKQQVDNGEIDINKLKEQAEDLINSPELTKLNLAPPSLD